MYMWNSYLKGWSLSQYHWYHLGTCEKCRFFNLTLGMLTRNFRWDQKYALLNSPNVSDAYSSLRTVSYKMQNQCHSLFSQRFVDQKTL